MMKIKPFSIPLSLSAVLLGGCLILQAQSVNAQQSQSDDTFNGSDVGILSPNSVPTVTPVISIQTVDNYVATTSSVVTQLENGSYFSTDTIAATIQQNIASVLTSPNDTNQQNLFKFLTGGEQGLTETDANAIINAIAGLFSDQANAMMSSSESDAPQNWVAGSLTSESTFLSQFDNERQEFNFEDDIRLRVDQAEKLARAIKLYNDLIKSLDLETLQNPPQALLGIRAILVEASEATRDPDRD